MRPFSVEKMRRQVGLHPEPVQLGAHELALRLQQLTATFAAMRAHPLTAPGWYISTPK